MDDLETAADLVEAAEEEQGEEHKSKRSRVALIIVGLLILLLCAITTTVDVWVNRDPDTVRFIARNLECLQCHTELIPELTWPAVHDPFLKKECTVCHTPHGKEIEYTVRAGGYRTFQQTRIRMEWLPLKFVLWAWDGVAGVTGSHKGGELVSQQSAKVKGEKSELTMPETELCWMCHGNLSPQMNSDYTHNPFAKGYCTACHDPHAAKYRVLLTMDERNLCVTCHPIGAQLARAQVHPPVQERWCLNCHDPHGSDWRGILVDNQRDLCFTCHPTVAPLSLKAVQHNPFLYDDCTGCHEPHGSNYMPLLNKNTPPLCYDCHPGIAKDFVKTSHHPVGTVELDCQGCHDPHAADYPALLTARNNNMCYECHGSAIQASYDASLHFDTLCIDCHTPHGSEWGPLLQQRTPDICLNCHAPHRYDDPGYNNHPVRPVFYDPLAGQPLTCVSSCHNPHGTPFSAMLKWPNMQTYGGQYWGKDYICRKCHSPVGVKY